MTAAQVAVLGYASVDSALRAPRFEGVGATTLVRPVAAEVGSQPGGIAHIARAAAREASTAAVSWVGADSAGARWTESLSSSGIDASGVEVAGRRSPSATLIDLDSGGTVCLFDAGDLADGELTARQRDTIAAAAWLLVTVAPSTAIEQALDALGPASRLAVAVKRDEHALPDALTAALIARASVISCTDGEHAWLSSRHGDVRGRMRPGALLVRTSGRAGLTWSQDSGADHTVSPSEVLPGDATGAGDTLAGAIVGHLAASRSDRQAAVEDAIHSAIGAVADLLRGRAARTTQKEAS